MKHMTKLTFCVDKCVPLKMYWYNRNSTAALLVSKGLLTLVEFEDYQRKIYYNINTTLLLFYKFEVLFV